MSDTTPSDAPAPVLTPVVHSVSVYDVTPHGVTIHDAYGQAWIKVGSVAIHGPLPSDVVAQLENLRDIGATIVAQATAAIEQHARQVA